MFTGIITGLLLFIVPLITGVAVFLLWKQQQGSE
jgi:hypothetical protein